ncbi:MAG: hypothetical protein HY916_02900 [Desulfovibrio sp.]|jgi:hypothetical protein|nr:hypothetical protein [Desulfovibrio sp.]
MTQPPAHDTMTLAGLAAANGPWLGARLHRLASQSGLSLPGDVVDAAVAGTSRVLAQVIAAEGRPVLREDEASDPAVALGREQALAHQAAGLSMPESLKVQRLLRRAYDDLVRESWVEKDSRARAHEDVERFFERALAGLVSAWTGHKLQPDPQLAETLALREDQLRRTLDAAKKLTRVAAAAKERAEALAAELAQAKAEAEAQARSAQEATDALIRELADAREAGAAAPPPELAQRVQALEAALAEAGQARASAEAALVQARSDAQAEAQASRAHGEALLADNVSLLADNDALRAGREALQSERDALRAEAETLRTEAEALRAKAAQAVEASKAKVEAAREEAKSLRTELRTLREDHAKLSDEAEAMRAHLADTGSRLAVVRQAEGAENLAKLGRALEDLAQAGERIEDLESELAQALQAGQTASREARERLEALQLRLDGEVQAHASAREEVAALTAERDDLTGRLTGRLAELEAAGATLEAGLEAQRRELDQALDEGRRLAAERDGLAERLKDAEAQAAQLAERLDAAEGNLAAASGAAAASEAAAQALRAELDAARTGGDDLSERLKQSEAQAAALAEELKETARQLILARSRAEEAEADARERGESLNSHAAGRQELEARLKEAETQVIALTGELAQARDGLETAQARADEAQRRAEEAASHGSAALLDAQAKAQAACEALAATRAESGRLLDALLAVSVKAVAAIGPDGSFRLWNRRFAEIFNLWEADLAQGLEPNLPRMAGRLKGGEPFLARMQELLASPYLAEDGMPLCTTGGDVLILRSVPLAGGEEGRLLLLRDESLERGMEDLLREVEGITRGDLGQSLTAFIRLPQELLDDPATTPPQAEKLAVIRDSGFRIVNTVNMAVDLFRMERGLYQPPSGRVADLAVAVRRAVKDAAALAAARRAAVALTLDGELPAVEASLPAAGDPLLVHGLVSHLLRDALESAPRGAIVRAELARGEAGPSLAVIRPGLLPEREAAIYFDKPLDHANGNAVKRARHAAKLIARSLGAEIEAAEDAAREETAVTVHFTPA